MGIFDKLFGKKKKGEVAPLPVSPAGRQEVKDTPSSLLEYFDKSEGTDELYEMLRSRHASEIEEVCKTFPIETLRLDWDSIQRDFRNNKRFELITVLAQILVRYEEILEKSAELRLPKSLPAKQLAETLMSRLMPFISSQQGVEIAHGIRIRLYDFAMALMQAGQNRDALTCLLASMPSIKDDHDFWICACRFNIAQSTKNPDDIAAAIESAEQIVSGKVRVPEKYAQGSRQMLSRLKGVPETPIKPEVSQVQAEPTKTKEETKSERSKISVSTNVRAGDCCELCHRNYEDEHSWGLECPNCISKLPNDEDYDILVRFCHSCLLEEKRKEIPSARMGTRRCPQCGAELSDSIL